jgi:P-type Mg2+ transporter
LIQYGANLLKPAKRSDTLTLLLTQFKSPIILTLIFAAGLSAFLHDPADAIIIIAIVLISGLLGFWQEKSAVNVLEKMPYEVFPNSNRQALDTDFKRV